MRRVLRTLGLILVCVYAAPVHSQQGSCEQRTIPVSVSSEDGTPVPPLTGSDFEATYRKEPVRITSAAINREPFRVVLLFDDSDSMHEPRSASAWNFAVDLGEDIVSVLPHTSEIGLEVFASELVRVANPTTERLELKSKVEALRTQSKSVLPGHRDTALWDAIIDSAKMLDTPRLGDVIYVITDGGENASSASLKRVTQTLEESGVRLFGFVFVKDITNSSRETPIDPSDLQKIVDDTGGTWVARHNEYQGVFLRPQDPALLDKLGKPTRLGLLLVSQYRQMFGYYRLNIDLPAKLDKREQLKLRLAGLSKSQQDNLVLRYPRNLFPCR
jgi:hypothetical protein